MTDKKGSEFVAEKYKPEKIDISTKRRDYDETELLTCKRCNLANRRTNIVIGDGDPTSRIWIVGEAPGEADDLVGKPFMDEAGTLLKQLVDEVGLRDKVYFTNLLCCRTPNDRRPTKVELGTCSHWLGNRIFDYKPLIVISVGTVVSKFLIENSSTFKISKERGEFFEGRVNSYYDLHMRKYADQYMFFILPTFNPNYLLKKQKPAKLINQVKEDLIKAKNEVLNGSKSEQEIKETDIQI